MPRQSKTGAIAIGALSLCAIVAIPAAAVNLDGGGFSIRAIDSDEPQFEATRGAPGSPGNPDGPDNPGGENPSSFKEVTYSCGPLSFTVTEDIYSFAKKNQELREAGRESEIVTHEDGWESIYTFDGRAVTEGFPTDGTKPIIAFLSTTPEIDVRKMTFLGMGDPGNCQIVDRSKEPQLGETMGYSDVPGYIAESRYVESEGRLVSAQSQLMDDGSVNFARYNDTRGGEPSKYVSDVYPYLINRFPDGSTGANILLPTAVEGYNEIQTLTNSSGNGYTYYQNRVPGNDGSPELAKRPNGPTQIDWDTSGNFISFSFTNADNAHERLEGRETRYTVDEYNALTGQSWNGSLHKTSDYNLEIPFLPTRY